MKTSSIIIKRNTKSDFLLSFVIYIILAVATVVNSIPLHIIGCMLLFSIMLLTPIDIAINVAVVMMPNATIVIFQNGGIGVISIAYAILFFRLFQLKHKMLIDGTFWLFLGVVLFISLSRLLNANFYDIFLVIQMLIALLVWNAILHTDYISKSHLFLSFRRGCLMTMLGMMMNKIFLNPSSTRLIALLDDANYTACIFFVIFMSSIFVFLYKMDVPNNNFYLVVSLIFGLLTGSRGFILAIGISICFIFIKSFTYKALKKIFLIGFAGISILAVMYFFKVSFIVDIYNNTIVRTMDLLNNYQEGSFMDITSGRIFLWEHYWKRICENTEILFFGRGFYGYHLTSNGGYFNMVAHNAYLSSIIGLGFVGTICLIMTYRQFMKYNGFFMQKRCGGAFGAIVLGLATQFIFLDGILDLRIVCFLSMIIILQQQWKQSQI